MANDSPTFSRFTLALAWMRVGAPGKAIDLLEYYLRETSEQANDADWIAQLLREARTSVARLN